MADTTLTKEEILVKLPDMMKTYYEQDSIEKAAKKVKEPLNKELKVLFKSAELAEFETDDLLATYGVQERSGTNDAKLLNRLRELGFEKAIETVERPNSAVLETLIYDGTLDPTLIADCFETKEVEVFSVKKKKQKKTGAKK
jgi:hypothetical protein